MVNRLLGFKMTLNIIYDNRRIERYQPLMDELERQGITDYKLWEPVSDTKSVVQSINLSHKQIVKWAMDQGLEEVAIAEDDLVFPAPDGWRYFLSGKPKNYDLYLGGCYSEVKLSLVQEWAMTSDEAGIMVCNERPMQKVLAFWGLHCYVIHSKYYHTFLNVPETEHIDTAQEGLGDFMVCRPKVAIQRAGFSANNMKEVNYNTILKQEDVYGPLHHFQRS